MINWLMSDDCLISDDHYDYHQVDFSHVKDPPWQQIFEPLGIFHRAVSVRLVDMYTKCQQRDVKEEIIQPFCRCLQIAIATIAFEIGLDCPDIWQVILPMVNWQRRTRRWFLRLMLRTTILY